MKSFVLLALSLSSLAFVGGLAGCGQDVATCDSVCALPGALASCANQCVTLQTACSTAGDLNDFQAYLTCNQNAATLDTGECTALASQIASECKSPALGFTGDAGTSQGGQDSGGFLTGYTCNTQGSGTCLTATSTSSAATASFAMAEADCADGGVASFTAPCPTTGLIGCCSSIKGALPVPGENGFAFIEQTCAYPGAASGGAAALSATECTSFGGTWSTTPITP